MWNSEGLFGSTERDSYLLYPEGRVGQRSAPRLNYKDDKAPAKVTFSTLEKLLSHGQGPWWGRLSPDMPKSMPSKIWKSQTFTKSRGRRSGLFLPIKHQPSVLSWRQWRHFCLSGQHSVMLASTPSVFLATRLEIRARFLYNMLGHAELSKEEKNYSVKRLPIYFCHKLSHGQSSEKGKQYRGSWNHSFSYANVTKCKSAVNTSNVGSFPQVWKDEGKKTETNKCLKR